MYKFAHTPHEIFLWIIGPYVDRNPTLVEAVLENFSNVQAWLWYYGIGIHEECIGDNNELNSGSAVMLF